MGAENNFLSFQEMIIIGLTGGIGSGKTKVLSFFKNKGILCYNSDKRAKILFNSNLKIKSKIKNYFGDEIYKLDKLDTKLLSSIVFNDSEKLELLNSIIHPEVAKDFSNFINNTDASIVVKESAILFESNAYLVCDYNILITAPVDIRIKRVYKRDNSDFNMIKSKMSNQWSDEKKIEFADFSIENIDWEQTTSILEKLLINIKSQFNVTD